MATPAEIEALYNKRRSEEPFTGMPKDFDAATYLKLNPDVAKASNGDPSYAQRHWEAFGRFENRKYTNTSTTPTTPTKPPPTDTTGGPKVVPGNVNPKDPNQINVVDYAGEIVKNPANFFTQDDKKTKGINEDMSLSNRVPDINENAAGTNINGNAPKYQMDTDKLKQTASQGTAAQASQVDPRDTATYEAQQTQQNIAQNGQMTAQQGQVSQGSQITDVPQIDIEGIASGATATGQALNDYAKLDLDDVDKRATVQGQLESLQSQFVGPNGEPKIPSWAAGTARNVSKIASFTGMTGTAATAAMAQALLEASLPIAQADSAFYQTVTLQNLSNKQAQTINKANVLSKMEQINVDNRMAAAIENAKKFMEMDMKNLDNKQQAELINTQNRVQSILEDAKAVNTQRMFTAEQANDMGKFYDNLNASIDTYNTSQKNNMTQFNVDQTNAMKKFNSEMENNREQFYKSMQYNIDVANAKWRQTVTLGEAQMKFEAAAVDVKNMVGISAEQLNQIWDRSDSLLDYLWKSTENDLQRQHELVLNKMNNDQKDQEGLGSIFGNIVGDIVGSADNLGDVFEWFSF